MTTNEQKRAFFSKNTGKRVENTKLTVNVSTTMIIRDQKSDTEKLCFTPYCFGFLRYCLIVSNISHTADIVKTKRYGITAYERENSSKNLPGTQKNIKTKSLVSPAPQSLPTYNNIENTDDTSTFTIQFKKNSLVKKA